MARLPKGAPTLRDVLREQRRLQRQQGTASSFSRSGMNVAGEGLVASDDFDGDLDSRDAGTKGWAMNGSVAAFGDVLFRPHSIGNDSLATPFLPQVVWQEASNFSVTVAWKTLISTSVTVPDGFTQMSVSAFGRVSAFNSYASADNTDVDYLYAVVKVGDQGSGFYPQVATPNGGSATNLAQRIALIGGLSAGDKVPITLTTSVDFHTWAQNSSNVAQMGADIKWLR